MLAAILNRGAIYAGQTPLASTITVIQTGPMQLTVKAGSFTTIGQAGCLRVPVEQDMAGYREKIAFEMQVASRITDANGLAAQLRAIGAMNQRLADMEADYRAAHEFCNTGAGELVEEHGVVRIWHRTPDGDFVEKSQTFVLNEDQVLNVTSDEQWPTAYQAHLVTLRDGTVDVLLEHHLMDGLHEYDPDPEGVTRITTPAPLLGQFIVPPGATDLSGGEIVIPVLTVMPGFPPGTSAKDWKQQKGTTPT